MPFRMVTEAGWVVALEKLLCVVDESTLQLVLLGDVQAAQASLGANSARAHVADPSNRAAPSLRLATTLIGE